MRTMNRIKLSRLVRSLMLRILIMKNIVFLRKVSCLSTRISRLTNSKLISKTITPPIINRKIKRCRKRNNSRTKYRN